MIIGPTSGMEVQSALFENNVILIKVGEQIFLSAVSDSRWLARLGEYTDELLARLGYDTDRVRALMQSDAVA